MTPAAPVDKPARIEGGLQLIVGLGNPGSKYERTRHNAGFWFVDLLARKYQGDFQADRKSKSELCKLRVGDHELLLQQPQTFMNLSGRAVRQICDYYKLSAQGVLVVHDEIDLPVGEIRLKQGGGHGGHNGLRDIIQHFGKEFWRLRVGVGHPGHRDDVINYVLSPAPADEQREIDQAIDRAIDLSGDLIAGNMESAMNQLHSRR